MPTKDSVVRAVRLVKSDNEAVERYMAKYGVTFNRAIHEILRERFGCVQMRIEDFIEDGDKVTTSDMAAKRLEYENLRAKLPKILGKVCSRCGSTDGVEYHHRKPLQYGGTNDISNIVPLCHRCHQEVHGAKPKDNAEIKRLQEENDALRKKIDALKKAISAMSEL